MTSVAIVRAQPRDETAIANMIQLYTHDFAELWAGQARGELNEDGLYEPYPYLSAYWSAPRSHPWLIRADGSLAGFALVNAHFHSGREGDFSMAEFFVVRKHRRGGVGLAAAQQIFAAHKGLWEAAVTVSNRGAQGFWRRAIARYREIEEFAGDGARWTGPIFRFRTD